MALNWLIAMIIAVSAVANTTTSTAKPGCRDVPCLDFDLNEAEARYAACLLKGESMGYHIGSVSVWWFCSHELNDVLKECTSESPTLHNNCDYLPGWIEKKLRPERFPSKQQPPHPELFPPRPLISVE
jgi:hypothetical protein